jgi:hypothetical protein
MSGWLWGRTPAPTAEEKASAQAEKNAQTMQRLQDQYDDKMGVAAQLGDNVKRFAMDAARLTKGSPQRVHLETQQRGAFATMQDMKKQADMLWAQIQALRRVTSNVQGMATNLEVHGRYQESNKVYAEAAGGLDVDAVTDTMDATHEHMGAHDEISEALAGRSLGGVVDPDEQDNEMNLFLGEYAASEEGRSGGGVIVDDRRDSAASLWTPQPVPTLQQEEARLSAYEEATLQKLNALSTHKASSAVAARTK